jgi:hypothetical protein
LWCSLETSVAVREHQVKDDFGEREAATIKRLDNIWMVQTGEVAWLVFPEPPKYCQFPLLWPWPCEVQQNL